MKHLVPRRLDNDSVSIWFQSPAHSSNIKRALSRNGATLLHWFRTKCILRNNSLAGSVAGWQADQAGSRLHFHCRLLPTIFAFSCVAFPWWFLKMLVLHFQQVPNSKNFLHWIAIYCLESVWSFWDRHREIWPFQRPAPLLNSAGQELSEFARAGLLAGIIFTMILGFFLHVYIIMAGGFKHFL